MKADQAQRVAIVTGAAHNIGQAAALAGFARGAFTAPDLSTLKKLANQRQNRK